MDQIPPEVFDWDSFIFQVTIHLAPENVDKFFELFRDVYEKASAMEQVTSFHVYEVAGKPGTITWIEHWDSTFQWALDNWLNLEYLGEYLKKTEPMFVSPREVMILKPKKL